MNGRKYPISLFVIGLLGNIVFKLFWLFIPALILMIIGSAVKVCLYIGLFILAVDVIASFIEQMMIRRICIEDSENLDFRKFQDEVFGEGNLVENIKKYTENQINKQQ